LIVAGTILIRTGIPLLSSILPEHDSRCNRSNNGEQAGEGKDIAYTYGGGGKTGGTHR
jgi:hypothetical protein